MTEAQFYKELKKELNSRGLDTIRLESHTTQVGIPDVFIQGHGIDVFVELKVINTKVESFSGLVPWRPGQQSFARNYYLRHNCEKFVLSLIRFEDALVVIPVYKLYKNNKIDIKTDAVIFKLKDVALLFYDYLSMYIYDYTTSVNFKFGIDDKDKTIRQALDKVIATEQSSLDAETLFDMIISYPFFIQEFSKTLNLTTDSCLNKVVWSLFSYRINTLFKEKKIVSYSEGGLL